MVLIIEIPDYLRSENVLRDYHEVDNSGLLDRPEIERTIQRVLEGALSGKCVRRVMSSDTSVPNVMEVIEIK